MKQSEIDRWMRRQARRDSRAVAPAVNWILIVSVIAIAVACLFIVLKLIQVA